MLHLIACKISVSRPWAGHRPHSRENFVHYNFLKLHYIRNKMTDVSPLAKECNSHVTKVTLKTIEML